MAVRMDCHGGTHVGRRRETNEDQFLIADLNKSMQVLQSSVGMGHQTRLFGNSQGKLLLVADGLGGHQAGERASTLAVDSVVEYVLNSMHWFLKLDGNSDEDFHSDLKAALMHCQEKLTREANAMPQRRRMGTTLTMVYLVWPRMHLVHVGDSRCLLHRDGQLTQITRDHTMQQLYRDALEAGFNGLSATDADRVADSRHVLWNALSADQDKTGVTIDVESRDLQVGDTLLLCTDGLYNLVPHDRVRAYLSQDQDARRMCEQLIEEANEAGGTDNITAIVARFCDPSHMPDCLEAAEVGEVPVEELLTTPQAL